MPTQCSTPRTPSSVYHNPPAPLPRSSQGNLRNCRLCPSSFFFAPSPSCFLMPSGALYFFLLLDLLLDDAAPAELDDTTLEAREGAVDVALLPPADLTWSKALFCGAG